MISETLTLEPTSVNFSPPVASELPFLETRTIQVADLITAVTDQWINEGDQMFAYNSKLAVYVDLRDKARAIPHYTNAIDVRDENAIPNKMSGVLDNAFAKLHELWKSDPAIESHLEAEREQFEVRYRQWYGTMDEPGVRDRMFSGFTTHPDKETRVSEREFEALEMKARRAYFLPTITTASESPV